MSHPLHGCWLRERAADKHLRALYEEIQRTGKPRPYGVEAKLDTETGDYIIWGHPIEQVDLTWFAVLVGDVLHNLRSALDYLMWELTIRHQGSPPDPLLRKWKRIEFPIFNSPRLFEDHAGTKMWGIRPGLRATLEGLQPYDSGQGPELWILHELSNIDKHRTVNLLGLIVKLDKITFHPSANVVESAPREWVKFEDGAEIARFRLAPPFPKDDVEMDSRYVFDVAFDERGPAVGGPIIDTLWGICAEVERITNSFDSEF